MKVFLPRGTFSSYKIVIGTLFLILVLLFPFLTLYLVPLALLVGKPHLLGAWLGMWRARRITWKYVAWMFFLSLTVSYWGMHVTSPEFLYFFTASLFAVHFLFDEYDLQEQKRTKYNLLAGFTPLFVILVYLFDFYYKFGISLDLVLLMVFVLVSVEVITLKEINWFFVQSKILLLFAIVAILNNFSPQSIIGVLLIFHYFFWFIFPVYKLHKYKKEERDGFIMILLLLVSTSLYFSTTSPSYGEEMYILAVKVFHIGTIIHILSTAPFGYLFGLKESQFN